MGKESVEMTTIYSKKSHKFLLLAGGFILLIVFIITGSFYNETKGSIDADQWNEIQKGMTVQEVVLEVGRPQNKTKNRAKIQESYTPVLQQSSTHQAETPEGSAAPDATHDVLGFMELEAALSQNKDVLMYRYLLNEQEHYIYFIDDIFLIKY